MFTFNAVHKFDVYKLYILSKGNEVGIYGMQLGKSTHTIVTLEEFINGHLTFTDRESYLSWVKSWKEQYKELSKRSRRMKYIRKDVPRELDEINLYAVGEVEKLRIQARLMLAIRAQGKVTSWAKKQESQTESTII